MLMGSDIAALALGDGLTVWITTSTKTFSASISRDPSQHRHRQRERAVGEDAEPAFLKL